MKEEQLAPSLPLTVVPDAGAIKDKAKGVFKYLGPAKLGIATGIHLPDHCQYDFSHERRFDVSYFYRSGLKFNGLVRRVYRRWQSIYKPCGISWEKIKETPISSMIGGNKGFAIAELLPIEPGFRQYVDSTHGI